MVASTALQGILYSIITDSKFDIRRATDELPISQVNYTNHPFATSREGGRELRQDTAPLRIKAIYDEANIPAEALDALKTVLVPRAIHFWEHALQVSPVDGPLHVQPFCNSRWSNGGCAAVQVLLFNMSIDPC